MVTAYIGLGSNLANPAEHVIDALHQLKALQGCTLTGVSNTYRSIAVGPGEQPDYVNAAARLETTLSPLAMLDALQAIEQVHGRVRDIRWGPRTLDLDLLLMDQLVLQSERLILPHPRAHLRDFVLRPLHDIDDNLHFPDGRSVVDYLAVADDNGLRVIQTSASLWQLLRG
jgi:2-amino-4-hydroxy-6-hydroxymethyldihydropteridine diphosphokinase